MELKKGGIMALQEQTAEQPVAVAYYYKVKWGYQDEFVELFKKNHYPVLEAQIKSGRYLRVDTFAPKFHGDGRADWTFLTIIVYKNWQAMDSGSQEKQFIKDMYPDQETFKREEQRRFELVEAHWDIPLKAIPMA
jgi:hypothetical protein